MLLADRLLSPDGRRESNRLCQLGRLLLHQLLHELRPLRTSANDFQHQRCIEHLLDPTITTMHATQFPKVLREVSGERFACNIFALTGSSLTCRIQKLMIAKHLKRLIGDAERVPIWGANDGEGWRWDRSYRRVA